MRIALIAPPWIPVPPRAYGGAEAVLDTLARGLTAAGHDVLLATTGDSTCPVERTWTYEHARGEDIGNVVAELRHLVHAYEAVDGADIVHDHTVAGPVYADRSPRMSVVTTNHGPFNGDMKAIYRSIARRVPLVAVSHHQASTADDIPIARVIHHGIEPSDYPVGAGRGGYFVFLGRMSPTKGVRQAIEIARTARVPLVIAAKMREPLERAYFDSEVAPLLGGDIHYAGELGGEDKVALLADATALLNPIQWDEPFGMCMIEALACGTPVLATRRGAVPEIVEHRTTGFVCTSRDDFVAAVSEVQQLDRRACRAAVERRFSATRMAAEHVALYEDILTGQAGVQHRHFTHTATTRTWM